METHAPVANRIAHKLVAHGHERTDPYFWLNQRTDPEVLQYLEAENAYLEAFMGPFSALREELFREIISRIKQDDQTVPYPENGYVYFTRYSEGKEYPVYCRRPEGDHPEEVLLDLNILSQGHSFYEIGHRSISPDRRYLAFGEDTVGRRVYTLRFKDLTTGNFLPDAIPFSNGEAAWASDNRHVFYTRKDPQTLRGERIMRHALGTPYEEDVEVFHEMDDSFDAHVYRSKSGKFLMILSSQTITTEYQILHADNPLGDFQVFHPRERGLEYGIFHSGDHFYIRTNLDARNFCLMKCPLEKTEKVNWTMVVPHRDDVLLEEVEEFDHFLALSERQNGLTRVAIQPIAGNAQAHYLQFSEAVYMVGTAVNRDMGAAKVRINYQSLTTPQTVYDYDVYNQTFECLKQEEVLGGFSPENYQAERVYAPARDGVKVPISIVYRKGFKKDGTMPLLLYGYGSYGISLDPYFSVSRISLLDRGFAFAIAHIRGGEDLGRPWYEDGKLLKKKNTFYDFIDSAEFLLAQQYCSKDTLFAMGGSAGGLLMGAVANLRPDLWKGIVAAVPFVDVVTTMLDESIPLTTFEYDEWGNPGEKAYYDYMLSYSPYDNVEAKNYPAMLVVTGLHDSQVQYWEPAKWVAKLRYTKTDHNPLLLYTNMASGHSGASGRFERFRETALEYAFLIRMAYGTV